LSQLAPGVGNRRRLAQPAAVSPRLTLDSKRAQRSWATGPASETLPDSGHRYDLNHHAGWLKNARMRQSQNSRAGAADMMH
jgi:hypothetical protein